MNKKLKEAIKKVLPFRSGKKELLPRSVQLKAKYPDIDDLDWEIINRVLPFTMTTVERLYAMVQAAKYIASQKVPGDVVECGVWRGGSIMAAANTLIGLNDRKRDLWLFDTFSGMTKPGNEDIGYDGRIALDIYNQKQNLPDEAKWCFASLEDVKANLKATDYPDEQLHFIVGKVEDTLLESNNIPNEIALLRLDTDWYESTRLELEILYPRLQKGGFFIIDDYGHWSGSRKATDEYFEKMGLRPFLHRIDYTGRIMQKF